MSFEASAIKTIRSGGSKFFYEEYTVTNAYIERTFGGNCTMVTITNDSATDTIALSWNGAALIADVKPGETLELATATRTSIYVRGAAGGDKVRIWAT